VQLEQPPDPPEPPHVDITFIAPFLSNEVCLFKEGTIKTFFITEKFKVNNIDIITIQYQLSNQRFI